MSNLCDINSGFTLGCRDNTGGLKNIYILSGSIGSIGGTTGLINSITGSGTFYKFELTRQTGDFTEAITTSVENGTIFYEQTVNAPFHKLQSSTRNKVRVLAKNPDIRMIVETNNGSEDGVGVFFLLGQTRGLSLSGGQGQTGTSFGDLNGYTLTFTGQEPEPASELSGSSLSAVLSGITVG
jgi:hypothetical protein